MGLTKISYGPEKRRSVAILGAGSWGTSVAKVIAENNGNIDLIMWAYEKSVVKTINDQHKNNLYLPDIALPANITATNNLKDAVSGAQIIILATPSKVAYDTCLKIRKNVLEGAHFGFLSKGFCRIENKIYTMSEAIARAIPDVKGRIAAIYGPSHAEEVCRGFHTCLMVAAESEVTRNAISEIITCGYVECRQTDDVRGVELGGTLKNPAAIAAGILSVLPKCGDNLAGALMAEALKEMLVLSNALNARNETVIDIAGLGDLIATSLSDHSRNRKFGKDIARQILRTGSSVNMYDRLVMRFRPEYVLEKMSKRLNYLAEGAYAIEPLIELARERGITIPVYRSLYEILLNNKEPRLLIETVKNPERFEEIYRETKIHVTRKKRGMERARGTFFRSVTAKAVEEKINSDMFLKQEILRWAEAVRAASPGDAADLKCEYSPTELSLLGGLGTEDFGKNISALLSLYVKSVTDRFSFPVSRLYFAVLRFGNYMGNALKREYGKGLFRSNISISGDVAAIRKTIRTSNVVYLPIARDEYDFLFVSLALRRMRLLAPRFMVNADIVRGRFRRMMLRLAGGFIVNMRKLEDPLYREVVKSYISMMIRYGVPVMFSPELVPSQDGTIQAVQEDFFSVVIETLYQSTEEIALVPITLSYYEKPFHEGAEGVPGSFTYRRVFDNSLKLHFSEPLLVSEYSHSAHFQKRVLDILRQRWLRDMYSYPHHIFCRIISENGYEIRTAEGKKLVKRFLQMHKLELSVRHRDVLRKGMEFVVGHDIGTVENKVLRVSDRDLCDYYGNQVYL
jgi:glycerol-3-phosphate dehydrogenase